MDRRLIIFLLLFACVHKSYEWCDKYGDRERQTCYYYDGYSNRHNDNGKESNCWQGTINKAICNSENTIPLLDSTDYTYLKILNSNISKISLNSFKNMSKLLTIIITNSSVAEIEFGAFNGVYNLESLSISSNVITRVTKGIFNHLLHLKALNLSTNKIKYVEEESFVGIDLQGIDISNNEIEDVSPFVENCYNLTIFDLSDNKVSSLEPIENCTSLVELKAARNNIKELSPYLFNKLPLNVLDLSSNILNDLDINTFSELYKLDTLDLSNNTINNGQLKIGMFQDLRSLRTLNLSSNSLKILQLGTFSTLLHLEILDVSNNKLVSFPEEMFHDLEKLRSLYINNNMLTTFSGPTTKAESELTINIDMNPINCQELSKIMMMYKKAMVRGNNYKTSNILGISCIPLTSNKILAPARNNLNENDKIDYTSILADFLDGIKTVNNELFRQSDNITTAIRELVEELQNNYKDQNVSSSIENYLHQNQETLKKYINQNQLYSNEMKEFFRAILMQTHNTSNILNEVLSENKIVAKQTNELGLIKLGLMEISQQNRQTFEKLLNVLNNTISAKEIVRYDLENSVNCTHEVVQSEKLVREHIGTPDLAQISNILTSVLVILIVFLVVFCLTVFYFIRSVKIQRLRSIDEVQL